MNLIRFFAQRSMLANVLTLMVLFIGAGVLSQIRTQELPDAAFPQVDIVTAYPGSSAQDVELNITNRLEKELRSIEGLRQFESTSGNGLSEIMLELSSDADADKMLRDIQQAVDRVTNMPADLPNPPRVTQRDTASGEVLRFGVTGPDDYTRLQSYSRQLEKQLRQLPGVGAVAMTGFREREFWIEANPDKLSRYQLTLDDLRNAVVNRNLSLSGGLVESWSQEQRLVTLTQYHSIEELQQLVIKTLPSGGLVRLKDVARVFDNFEQARETGMINGDTGILFSVSKTPGADIDNTVKGVLTLLASETARLDNQFAFPVSVNIADDMASKFNIVATNGLIGLALVLLVLTLFLKRRIAFWVAISIPVCVLGVVALLPITGQVLDSITLAALLLVIGIIVDDSVIVAEAIYQQFENGQSPIDAAVNGISSVFQPVLANLLTTALVFVPMFFLPGSLGLLTVVIPSTVLLALLLSMLECTFLMPAHLAHSLAGVPSVRGGGSGEKADWFDRPKALYRQWLARALCRKKTVLVVALLTLLGSFALVSTMKIDFFPREAARYIQVTTEVKPGALLEQIRKDHQELEDAFRALPDNERQSFEMSYASPVST
nr:efflux RND transporter permease subunit [Endozoicomonas sp.]